MHSAPPRDFTQAPVRALLAASILLMSTMASIGLSGCSGQIRNAEKIKSDPYLKYTSDELNKRRTERVLELLPPDSPANLNDLGIAHARRLELGRAEERLNAAIKTRPGLTLPYLNLARLYAICEEPDNASRVYLHMAANRRLSGERLFRLARGLYDQGRQDESLALMGALVRQERHGPRPANWLGFYHLDRGELAAANRFFSRSLEIRKTDGEALYGKGLTHYRAGDYDRAVVYLQSAHERRLKRPGLLVALATALFRSGEGDDALELIEAAPARDRKSSALVDIQGEILLLKNYRRNLRSLPASKDRPALLRKWYGTDDPDELTPIYDEFDLLY